MNRFGKNMLFFTKEWAGYFLALGAAQFLIVMMLGASIAPGYSMHLDAISDLGTVAQTELIFNASLFLIGLLFLAGGYVLYRVAANRQLVIIFALGGIGAMGAGLIPLDNHTGVHGLFALLAFVFMNLGAIVAGRMAKHPLDKLSVLAGLIGLVFVPLMILVDAGSLDVSGSFGHGGTERMIAYPALIWMMIFGGYLIASPDLKEKRRPAIDRNSTK